LDSECEKGATEKVGASRDPRLATRFIVDENRQGGDLGTSDLFDPSLIV